MTTVTGKTSAKIDELLSSMLVGAVLDNDGQLVLTTKGGSTISAGSVSNSLISAVVNGVGRLIFTTRQGTQVDAGLVGRPIDSWPVGSLFMSATPTDPNTLLGGGTWARWGEGRMPLSQDSTQPEFDGLEETGGAKTRTLTEANLPPHEHTINHDHPNPTLAIRNVANTAGGGSSMRVTDVGTVTGASGGNLDTATVNIAAYAGASGSGDGTSVPLDTLPPYITCYMWKRTA